MTSLDVDPSSTSTTSRSTLHQTLALACRILAGEEVSRVSFGHVSARTTPAGSTIAMRGRPAADRGLQFCTERDIVEMGLDGRVIDPDQVSAPREKFAHLGVYLRRPDVQSVVHVHPRWVVALSAARVALAPIYGAYDPDGCRLGARDLATFSSAALIDTPELGLALADTLGDRSACVLEGHGILTVGESVEVAVLTAIAVTELAHVTWLAAAVAPPTPISVEDQHAVLQDRAAAELGATTTRGVRPSSAAWQHYAERDRLRQRSEGYPS